MPRNQRESKSSQSEDILVSLQTLDQAWGVFSWLLKGWGKLGKKLPILGSRMAIFLRCCRNVRGENRKLAKSTYWFKIHKTISHESRSVVSDSSRPHGLYSTWNSPGQNTGAGSLSLLQGIFPTEGSNPGLPHGPSKLLS